MKKIVSFMTSLALIGCQPCSIISFAEETSLTQSEQKELVSLNLKEDITVTNGMFTITYDADKITAENVVLSNAFKGALTAVNQKTPGKIVIGFASSSPLTLSESIADITFSCAEYNDFILDYISFTTDELITLDETGSEKNVSTDGIELVETVSTPYAAVTHTVSDEQGHLPVYIDIERNSAFTNGLFTVSYDPDMLTFNEGKSCELMENAMCEIRESTPGTIKIAFISDKPVSDTGHAFLLDFTGKKNGETVIDLTADEFSYISENGSKELNFTDRVNGNYVYIEMSSALVHVHGSANEENTAVIDISENSGVTNGLFTVTYDTSAAEFTGAEPGENFSDIIIAANESEQGTVKIAFVSDKSITEGGDFIKLHFTSSRSSECPLSIEVNEFSEINTYDVSRDIPFTEINGTVSITGKSDETETEPDGGDINDDGAVNTGDLLSLIKMILTADTAEYNASYDLNNDGSVNSEDLLTLRTILMK